MLASFEYDISDNNNCLDKKCVSYFEEYNQNKSWIARNMMVWLSGYIRLDSSTKATTPIATIVYVFITLLQVKWWWLAISSTSSFSQHVSYRITDLHCQGNSLVNWLSKWTIQTCARKVTERHFSHFSIKMFLFVLTVNLLQMDLKNKY